MPQIGARLGGSHVLLQQPCAPTPIESYPLSFRRLLCASSRARRIGGALERLAQITFACRLGRPLPSSQHWLTAALPLSRTAHERFALERGDLHL